MHVNIQFQNCSSLNTWFEVGKGFCLDYTGVKWILCIPLFRVLSRVMIFYRCSHFSHFHHILHSVDCQYAIDRLDVVCRDTCCMNHIQMYQTVNINVNTQTHLQHCLYYDRLYEIS